MKKNRFISGIFNYCDYWCERCPFTRRCRNFSMGRELERTAEKKPPINDATNAEFWNGLADKLREATIVGKSEAWSDDDDFDLAELPDSEWEAREDARRDAVRRHPLVRQSQTYMMRAHKWLKGADKDLKALAHELLEAAGNRFEDGDFEEEALEIGEMLEVVTWYHTLIAPKLGRAIGGLLEANEPGKEKSIVSEMRLQDANGTGKVALIAIERSMAAWLRLRDALPHREDDILAMLALLEKMQRGIHAALPGAQSFLRPGFDGEPPDDDEKEDP